MPSPAVIEFESAVAAALRSLGVTGSRMLVGISGGADSVALLRALVRVAEVDSASRGERVKVAAAHLDHQLRGEESTADAQWVGRLCEQLGVSFIADRVDVRQLAEETGCGLEEAARNARYEFLKSAARQQQCRFVLLAHTAEDQVETVLHRILRGTGLDGLRGIPPRRPLADGIELARPLIEMRRTDIEAYLAALGQDWRTDRTNQDRELTRNRIRHELLPALRNCYNPQVDAALLNLSRHASGAQEIIEDVADTLLKECCLETCDGVVRLDAARLRHRPLPLIRELFKQLWKAQQWPLIGMGFDQWSAAASVALGTSVAVDLPGNVRVERRGTLLALSRKKPGPRVETG